MQQPIQLYKAQAVQLISAALAVGKLSAQGETPACRYRDDSGNPCAVGVCFSDEEAEFIKEKNCNSIGVAGLKTRGYVHTNDDLWFSRVQEAHDNWAAAARDGSHEVYEQSTGKCRKITPDEAKARFIAALNS